MRPLPADLLALENFFERVESSQKRKFRDTWGFDVDTETFLPEGETQWTPINDDSLAASQSPPASPPPLTRTAAQQHKQQWQQFAQLDFVPVPSKKQKFTPTPAAAPAIQKDAAAAGAAEKAQPTCELFICPSSPQTPLDIPPTPQRSAPRNAGSCSPLRMSKRRILS
ncbi:CDI domain-containing protein [Pseudoscourfieldia marina]